VHEIILPIFDIDDLSEQQTDASLWTAVIPAAGSGSRLGYKQPKILYPLLNRPILDWLLDAVETVAYQYVFILSPSGRSQVEPHLQRRLAGRYRVVIQEYPTGMADAVLLAEPHVETPYTLVIWGDQVTISSRTLRACTCLHQRRPMATLTLPSLVRKNPYIDLVRDGEGKLLAVHQARESEIHNEYGENDCGVFFFTSQRLFSILTAARYRMLGIGGHTREFNLLPILPKFECGKGSVCTIRIHDPNETLGVNTEEEGRLASEVLRQRGRLFGHY
jgi:bifunctional UDP-N-acetylglucosamine pyrophosphorylase/glucosamine-1-phosphate N-acetyltransferase